MIFMHVEIDMGYEHSVRVWTPYPGHDVSVHILCTNRQQGGDGEMLLCSLVSNH